MLHAKTNHIASTTLELSGISLIEGEEIQASIGISNDGSATGGDIVLLTDRRVIHNKSAKSKKSIAFAVINDIFVVEFNRQPAIGYSSFVWAGLAFIVSFMLWRVIENQMISIAAAVIVAIMGVYLIVDRLTSRGEDTLLFRAGGADIQVELNGAERRADAEVLVTRLFELKEERVSSRYSRPSEFSPR